MPSATGQAADAFLWPELKQRIQKRRSKRCPDRLWPKGAQGSQTLRWGHASATGHPLSPSLEAVSRLASGEPLAAQPQIDFCEAAESFCDSLSSPGLAPPDYSEILIWAYALPELVEHLDERLWWDVLNRLQSLQRAAAEQSPPHSPAHLMLGGELGLVLAWSLADLPSCQAMQEPATAAALAWLAEHDAAIEDALAESAIHVRLILAAGLRVQRLLKVVADRKLPSAGEALLWNLTTWAAALTNPDGVAVFSTAAKADVREDGADGGLLSTAAAILDAQSLGPAVQASLGHSKSRGRLAWQVRLPEPMLYSEAAGLAAMLPEWDVRRGRVFLSYGSEPFRLEVQTGRARLIQGTWEVQIQRGQQTLAPCGPWTETCQYTDDDVHYLELQQAWSGDLMLQRQIMVVRDDRCVMLADAVVSQSGDGSPSGGVSKSADSAAPIQYRGRWQTAPAADCQSEEETWEVILNDSKPRALALPLALPEWRAGPAVGSFDVVDDGLQLTVRGKNNVYAPLWIDGQRRRFTKPRTWRQLTVAEQLRIVGDDEAVAYRIEVGSDQWLVYRSLVGRVSRTALGKNLVADFYCGRFDSADGYCEELVTVDDAEEEPEDSA